MYFKSVSQRIFFWLMLISLLPLLILSEVLITEFRLQVKKIEFRHLSQVSAKKVESINRYIDARIADVEILSRDPLVSQAMLEMSRISVQHGLNSPEYQREDELVRMYFSHYLTFGYYDLFLITPDGDIVFTVLHESDFATNLFDGPYQESGLAHVTHDALAVFQTEVSDFEFYMPSNELAAFVATPIIHQGELLGILALQVSTDRIFDVVADNFGLGETGETVVARVEGDTISFIGNLKFNDNSKFHVPLDGTIAAPMRLALNGGSGSALSVDYRAEKVLAVWHYLPVFRWGIVVKKDVSEVFSVVDAVSELRWVVLSLMFIVIAVTAYFIGLGIVRPIHKLTQGSGRIARGDFHYRVVVDSRDEVGLLAETFNAMAAEIEVSHEGLLHKVDEAERYSQAKSAFLSRMSHELRTPMNAILGFGQLLKLDDVGFSSVQKDNINEILDAGHHLLDLINEVLDLDRIDSGKMEVNMGPVVVAGVMQQCLALMRPLMTARHITLIDHVSAKEGVILADATRFKQVLLNYLSNAVKYNREHGCITLTGEYIGSDVFRISITDTGEGLTAEEVGKLFVPFERLHKDANVEGTGIGLVISKHLVELMGGTIGVESSQGVGSTFWLEMKLAKQKEKGINGANG